MTTRCHYCGEKATTKDHIVPKSLIAHLSQKEKERNTVPACAKCNGTKGAFRSKCDCDYCMDAWRRIGPVGWESIKVVDVGRPGVTFPAATRPFNNPCPVTLDGQHVPSGTPSGYCVRCFEVPTLAR